MEISGESSGDVGLRSGRSVERGDVMLLFRDITGKRRVFARLSWKETIFDEIAARLGLFDQISSRMWLFEVLLLKMCLFQLTLKIVPLFREISFDGQLSGQDGLGLSCEVWWGRK